MDKNMIKIDDFVRQRLSGGEEKERAGAWLQMRDLLDEKMPLRPAAGGYNWRRMLTAATGLLLFASLTVGGYKMYTGFRPDDEALAVGNRDAAYKLPNGNASFNGNKENAASYSTDNEVNTVGSKENNALVTDENSTHVSNKEDANNYVAKKLNIAENNIPHSSKAETAILNNKPTKNTETITDNNLKTTTSTPNSANNVNDKNNTALAGNNTNVNNNNTSNINAAGSNNSNASGTAATNTNTNTNAKIVGETNTNEPLHPTPASQPTASDISAGKNALNTTEAFRQDQITVKQPVTEKDSMSEIAVTEKLKVDFIRRTVTSSKDTTSVGKLAIENPSKDNVAAATAANANAAKTETVATNAALKTETKSLAKTSKTKVHRSGLFDAQKLKEMVIETQFRLGQVKFHTGITGGINNYMFGPNSMMGIQIGLRETVDFDEKWSMFTEMKYMQRFNKNYVVKDNYWQVGAIVGNEYRASEIEHFFKFSALHTIEMPVAVRYALFRQLHIFVGGNLVYNFKINAEEITRASEERTYTGSSFGLQYQPSVHLDHFGSRFSAGYLAGFSYQVSPTFDIDARVIKNFWDNAAGSGPRKISDQLLYRPSLQFSIGYKFPQRNKIPPAK